MKIPQSLDHGHWFPTGVISYAVRRYCRYQLRLLDIEDLYFAEATYRLWSLSKVPIKIEVIHGDALDYATDVLALKFAQGLYGVDRKAVGRLAGAGISVNSHLPKVGESLLINTGHAIAASEILFIGVEPLGRFDYQTIRGFAHSVISTLSKAMPSVEHVAMTLHGRGFGLDEAEAFRAEVAGVLDAVAQSARPAALKRISIIERDAEVAARMTNLLDAILPSGSVSGARSPSDDVKPSLDDARTTLGAVGHDSHEKPHVFVAMPFAEEYADRFHYGIRAAVNAAGYLCERADLESFTGDIIAWVKDRIGSAALVVADLTAANPNVYLEVGYAWGRGVNTVLLVAHGNELKFDVQSQRCLEFRSIRHLEELLTNELGALHAAGKR